MPIGSLANTTSIAEIPKKFVFPIEDEIRSKIPLWMKFYCYEYTNTALGRALSYSRAGGGASIPLLTKEKAQILVPAPVNFQSTTAHNYGQEPSQAMFLFSNVIGGALEEVLNQLPPQFRDFLRGVGTAIDTVDQQMANLSGFNSEIPSDLNDTMYQGNGSSRTFEIRMNLPCLTDRDSKAAGSIIRAFEALSLPTARSLFSLSSTKFFHPPLWVFGIGPADSLKFDPDWTGYPQISVLRTVSHKKTAFETNSLAAIGYEGILKPVAYTVTLLFQELEPAIRVTSPFGTLSTQITNRSGALVTSGVNPANIRSEG